ncbi:replication/maintenance protein RepL [Bacillus paranthracis]
MQVVKYILENMDKSTNTLIITTRELTEKSKVSRQTVIDTLKTLEQAQIITRRTGAIMIHPSLVHRGKDTKRNTYLLDSKILIIIRLQLMQLNKPPKN